MAVQGEHVIIKGYPFIATAKLGLLQLDSRYEATWYNVWGNKKAKH